MGFRSKHDNRDEPLNRIDHSDNLVESAARFMLFAGCLLGIAFVLQSFLQSYNRRVAQWRLVVAAEEAMKSRPVASLATLPSFDSVADANEEPLETFSVESSDSGRYALPSIDLSTIEEDVDSHIAGAEPAIEATVGESGKMDASVDVRAKIDWGDPSPVPSVAGSTGVADVPSTTAQPTTEQPTITQPTLVLTSGLKFEASKVFRAAKIEFDFSLDDARSREDIQVNELNFEDPMMPGHSVPVMIISHRQGVLHGPFASYQKRGKPMAKASYKKGQRHRDLLAWEEGGRPLAMEQYASGRLHGLRILFRKAIDEEKEARVWMVQEWQTGRLNVSHLVTEEGLVKSIDHRDEDGDKLSPKLEAELSIATERLRVFRESLDSDELKLKKMVSESYARYRREVLRNMRERLAAGRTPQLPVPYIVFPKGQFPGQGIGGDGWKLIPTPEAVTNFEF